MPQFILDTSGQVLAPVGPIYQPDGRAVRVLVPHLWAGLDAFTQGYIEALFFTEEEQLCEESDGARNMPDVAFNTATMESHFVGGDSFGFSDLAPETLARIIADCEAFKARHVHTLAAAYGAGCDDGSEYTPERAGHDFWLTRNGHGAGFWDRGLGELGDTLDAASGVVGEVNAYLGDDGKVYLS